VSERKLEAYIEVEGVTLHSHAGNLELTFPHGNQEFTVTYKVVEGEKLQVLAVKNLTHNYNVSRTEHKQVYEVRGGVKVYLGYDHTAVWDAVVMCALELHERLHGRTTEYYDVPVCEGTFSYY
jgi:hypothetical protein